LFLNHLISWFLS